MRPVNIPIRSLTPPPEDEGLEFMPMPREMSTFEMPRAPEPGPDADVAGARDVLQGFIERMGTWLRQGGEPPSVDLAGLRPATLRALNESLGEGEVAARVPGPQEISIQETVFSGVWREQHLGADGSVLHDYLIAAPVPPVLQALAQQAAAPKLRATPLPAGAMNVAPLLAELQEAMDKCGPTTPAHVMNLTLLPLSPEDSAHLDALLDGGSVVILSRGFGNCRISSTAARGVWRVQYFNNMQTLILNTLEVVEMPEAAVAAPEDLQETHGRLLELLQWLTESLQSS